MPGLDLLDKILMKTIQLYSLFYEIKNLKYLLQQSLLMT